MQCLRWTEGFTRSDVSLLLAAKRVGVTATVDVQGTFVFVFNWPRLRRFKRSDRIQYTNSEKVGIYKKFLCSCPVKRPVMHGIGRHVYQHALWTHARAMMSRMIILWQPLRVVQSHSTNIWGLPLGCATELLWYVFGWSRWSCSVPWDLVNNLVWWT